MPVAIKGTGGGSVTLSAGAAATDTTLTLPNTTGTVLQSGTAVTVAQGGTGAATLAANNVLLGNGTSALQTVAPGTSGNLLTSNGTTWGSSAPAASVTTLAASTGISVSGSTGAVTITNTGVTSAAASTGIGVSAATGAVTFTNTGVTSLTTSSGLSTNTSATGAVSVTNTGVTSLVAGSGISISASTGSVTITNTQATGTLPVAAGGTGAATLTANAVLIGNGTSAVTAVAPSTAGNVLTSNGTTWASTAPSGGGQIQSQLFVASGTWTCPTGVTQVQALVVGSGGGGAYDTTCNVSGTGGSGGLALGFYTVVPGTGYTITIAGAGTGNNNIDGTTGGSVSFAAFASATGGGGGFTNGAQGALGVGSSGTIRNTYGYTYSNLFYTNGGGAPTNTPVAYSASTVTSSAGAGGTGYKGGTNGIVYLQWVG